MVLILFFNFLGLKCPFPLMNFVRLVYVPSPIILRETIDLALERALEVLISLHKASKTWSD